MLDYFDKFTIPSGLKVLVLAPHPDDFDAIAVTLKKFHDNGNILKLVVVSEASSGVQDNFAQNHPDMTKAQIRENEQLSSCSFFGLPEENVSFLRLSEDKNGDPVESEENMAVLREILFKIAPDIVFMPHWNDTNPGHKRTYSMFKKMVYSCTVYLNRDAKTIGMQNDIYTAFNDDAAEWKAKLLRFHRSQQERNLNTRGYGFDERVLRINQQTAEENNCFSPYAEVFEIEKLNFKE
jgi:LmbE family N-acetylglucosaminyl deacetylase